MAFSDALEFRNIYQRHALFQLRQPITRGVIATHSQMPQFQLSNEEMAAIVAYINLKIPLISDEAINIGKSWVFEEELTELFHERPQAILPHGRDELIMQAALAEQRMDTSLGCAGL